VSDLDAHAVTRELERLGARIGTPCTVLRETGSTNDDARRGAQAGAPHGAVFLADAQTQGRGRGGNAWHSPPGESLYLSILLRPNVAPGALPRLALVTGVAVARVVDALLPEPQRAQLKWPNDVHVAGKKLAGILVEASFRGGALGAVVVGLGLNVHTTSFPPELEARATSLQRLGASPLDRSVLAARLCAAIGDASARFEACGLAPFLPELTERDALRGRALRVGDVSGMALGLDAEGRLLVRDEAGVLHAVVAGEPVVLAPSSEPPLRTPGSQG
jgi:BirA family biotin operon repressor/biotin-[acetyl-CoA-carboxylase] ligase